MVTIEPKELSFEDSAIETAEVKSNFRKMPLLNPQIRDESLDSNTTHVGSSNSEKNSTV
jgi:hypothetical protein